MNNNVIITKILLSAKGKINSAKNCMHIAYPYVNYTNSNFAATRFHKKKNNTIWCINQTLISQQTQFTPIVKTPLVGIFSALKTICLWNISTKILWFGVSLKRFSYLFERFAPIQRKEHHPNELSGRWPSGLSAWAVGWWVKFKPH